MRKIVVSNLMTLDGYYEGAGSDKLGSLFKYFPPEYDGDGTFDRHNLDRLRDADILLLGRNTFHGWNDYWYSVPDDPNASQTRHEFAALVNPMPKIVISDTLTFADVAQWGNVQVIRQADVPRELATLKQHSGKTIQVFGSRRMWLGVLAHGLIDEVHLAIFPMLAGGGTRLFEGPPAAYFTRMGVYAPENSGNVFVRYTVKLPG